MTAKLWCFAKKVWKLLTETRSRRVGSRTILGGQFAGIKPQAVAGISESGANPLHIAAYNWKKDSVSLHLVSMSSS